MRRFSIAQEFHSEGNVLDVREFGNGNINDTYLVTTDAIRLLAFELGIRFLADHLAGDVYFKVRSPEHNLQRALVQFKLTESIEANEGEIRNIIGKMAESAK